MKTLKPGKLLEAAFVRSHYAVTVDNDVTLADVMTPGFWRDHSGAMRVGAVIEVRRQDETLDLTARVVSVTAGMVKLRAMFPPHNDERNIKAGRKAAAKDAEDDGSTHSLDDEGGEIPVGYKVKFSPATGYFVLLTGAGGVVQNLTQGQKNLSKPEAIKIAIEHHRQATTPANV